MIPRFGRAVPQLSMISKRIADIIFDDYGHLRRDLVQPWLSQAELKQFADSVYAKCAALETYWGFIDGTVWPLCKPGLNQRALCNSQKGSFNKISVRCGTQWPNNELTWSCWGKKARQRTACRLWPTQLTATLFFCSRWYVSILLPYAFTAFQHIRYGFICRDLFKGDALTLLEQQISQVRVAVERVFGDITNYFAYLD